MVIKLNREYKEKATTGIISIAGEEICYSLERPWDSNKKGISCIPEGEYPLTLKMYGRWHDQWKDKDWYRGVILLIGTAPRSEILIHTANYVHQLNGCIAPGTTTDVADGIPCVWRSTKALMKLYPIIADAIEEGEYVELQIKSNETNKKN